jgi:hypothetical protein
MAASTRRHQGADAAPPPARVANLTDIEEARRHADLLAVQKAHLVPRHVGVAFGPLRALEAATATGDALLVRLVARAILADRPGWWVHDHGPRTELLLGDDGTVIGERLRPSRCTRKHDARGICAGLRAEVRALRADAWGRVWARVDPARRPSEGVGLYGARDAADDPPRRKTAPRKGPRLRLQRQAAAVSVQILKHGHGALPPHDWVSTATAFFARSVGGRDAGKWSREVNAVRKLEETVAQHALRTWRLAYRGI